MARKVSSNGTLSMNERERGSFIRLSAVPRRVRCKRSTQVFDEIEKIRIFADFDHLMRTSRKEVFFMEKTEKKNVKTSWQEVLFSRTLAKKNVSHKVAYIAVLTAFVVAANMFEFKLADTQFSCTLVVSALAGIIIGPLFGFLACFLGDLVGFLVNSSGFAYMPWIGLAMGMVALIAGFVVNGIGWRFKGALIVKLLLVSVLTFLVCTVGINTTAFWLVYNGGKVPYATYLFSRLIVQGQIWNSLFNYALLFLVAPALKRIKMLKIDLG